MCKKILYNLFSKNNYTITEIRNIKFVKFNSINYIIKYKIENNKKY